MPIIARSPTNLTSMLSNGVVMPLVGFGCAGYVRSPALQDAIDVGYTLFDTAQAKEWYLEEELGHAIATSKIEREQLFLTSKLHPRDLGATRTLEAFPDSLKRLRTTYLDAFLLHYPRCFGDLCPKDANGRPTEPEGTWRDAWVALEKLYNEGKIRAIGVSNFSPSELQQLLDVATVKPHIVQSWMDPLQQARELRRLCKRNNVQFQAYSTLGTQHRTGINPVMRHPTLNKIAAELDRPVAQVVLRWAVQSGAAVIPRSTKRTRMAANLALADFELSSAHMMVIDSLDGSDPRAVHAPPSPPKLCKDEHANCEQWADAGECDNNPAFMHQTCAGSCGTCAMRKNNVEL